jgi:hypothetical protein
MKSGDAPLVCAHHPIALRAAIAMRDKGSAAEAQGVRPRFHIEAEEQPACPRRGAPPMRKRGAVPRAPRGGRRNVTLVDWVSEQIRLEPAVRTAYVLDAASLPSRVRAGATRAPLGGARRGRPRLVRQNG